MVLLLCQDPRLPEEPPVHGSALGFSWLTLQSSVSQKGIWKNTDSRHLSLPKPGHAGGHCAPVLQVHSLNQHQRHEDCLYEPSHQANFSHL